LTASVSRRDLILTSASLLAARRSPAAAGPRPNVLFLLADDQTFRSLHALNNSQIQTPNLDKLMQRGTTFTHACIMGGTVPAICMPSRAMLLTGQTLFHVTDSIVQPKAARKREKKPFALFPEVFRQAGYETYGIGKWHNGPPLFARCFNHAANVFFGGMTDHLTLEVADYDPSGEYPAAKRHPGGQFSSELFSDSAIHFLNDHPKEKPFLMYVAYTAPHDPRMPPKEYAALYNPDRIEVPPNFLPQHPFDNGELHVRDEELAPFPRTQDRIRHEIADYYGMITHLDAQICRVLATLDKNGLKDSTYVVFAADNGLAVGQHGLLGKQNLYDHSIRVPLIVAGPGIFQGEKREGLCYLLDLFPTLCEWAGLPTHPSVEGRNLVPMLRSSRNKGRQSVFLAYRNVQRGIRTDDWKLIRYNAGGQQRLQLFDLRNDPWEMRDLASSAKYAGQIRNLDAELKQWMRTVDDPVDLDLPNWGLASA